jgi:hypothetical protein
MIDHEIELRPIPGGLPDIADIDVTAQIRDTLLD